jgi:hypothetical protein
MRCLILAMTELFATHLDAAGIIRKLKVRDRLLDPLPAMSAATSPRLPRHGRSRASCVLDRRHMILLRCERRGDIMLSWTGQRI